MKHYYFLLLFFPILLTAQDKPEGKYTVDAHYFYGNIIPHRKSIQHLITAHPEGVMLSVSRKTFGKKEWEQSYNYPDYGFSFHYQDMKNETLGDMYGLYGHYSFYFLKRNLMFRIGQGVAYNTNPYDRETNFRNYAYGAHVMPTTYFLLNYMKPDLWEGLGVQAGMIFIHHSNASAKAPNTSTNTFAVNVGLNYTFDRSEDNQYIKEVDTTNYKQPVKFNFAFKGGFNESDIIGSGQKPYYALSAYVDKRWCRKSAFQLGVEVFWPEYLKEYIKYKAVAYPEEHVNANADYRKIGVFVGHELFINKISIEGQIGYYVYSPFNSTGKMYQRIGMKYYFSDKIFSTLGLKTHAAKAEVMEFGVGVRL
jgi:hypothetical protein